MNNQTKREFENKLMGLLADYYIFRDEKMDKASLKEAIDEVWTIAFPEVKA